MSTSLTFQERLLDLTSELDIKKSVLHKYMGVDYRSLSNALNYGILPTTRILMRIADYFNVSLPYLLGETNDEYFSKAKEQQTFSSRLICLCKEKDVTYYEVSQKCHFDKSYISRWLKMNYLPSLELLSLIAGYFEVSVDYLLGRTDDRN